jgi:ribosomal protein S18 acetylase RimI-like enzyme
VTTTLRPAEPERRGPDGARSRRYLVCVNSRPVGSVLLATDRRRGPSDGRIKWLGIDEPDRRRGRATVAALAAEEVLRSWGCRRVQAAIPAEETAALHLAAILGYTERNRSMAKEPAGPPPELPEGSSVRPMTAAEYEAWRPHVQRQEVGYWTDRGMAHDRAVAMVAAEHRERLPDGHATAGTALLVLSHGGADVGRLWLRPRDPAKPETGAWVSRVEVDEAHRGRGHGRTLMLAAERECHAAGVRTLGLNVRTDNAPAVRLYESLGYRVTAHHLAKPLL